MFKKLILIVGCFFILLINVQAFSYNDIKELTSKNIKGYTILNLEENGESLQYNKKQLSKNLINSKLEIDSFEINSDNKVFIEGKVYYDNKESKDFILEGELQNSPEEIKERVILKLTDKLNNFEVVDFSLYKSSQDLTLFDSKVNQKSNVNIFTIYLLDKENRNFSIFENNFKDSNDINYLFSNRERFNEAEPEDIFWISKVLKVTETSLDQAPQLRGTM